MNILFFYILLGPLLRTRGVVVAYRKRQCIFSYIFFLNAMNELWLCECVCVDLQYAL